MGVWNESPFDSDWIVRLRRALDAADLASTKIIAADNVYWGDNRSNYPNGNANICQACLDNATLRAAVGAIVSCAACSVAALACQSLRFCCSMATNSVPMRQGSHYDWDNSRGGGAPCQELRERYGTPLFISEGHHGAAIQAKVGGNITGYAEWPLFDGYAAITPYSSYDGHQGTGVQAREPWSGNWAPGQAAAPSAALTQFTSAEPGLCSWLPNAAVGNDGILSAHCDDPAQLANCIIAAAVDCQDTEHGQTIVIETSRHGAPTNVTSIVKGARTGAQWQLWQACTNEADVAQWLHTSGPRLSGPALSFVAEAGCTYALTTSTVRDAWQPLRNASGIPKSAAMALPYADNFSSYTEGQPVRFFTAESGSFEAARAGHHRSEQWSQGGAGGGATTMVMRQQVVQRPIEWEHNAEPFALMGDNRWPDQARLSFAWSDYSVTVRARIAGPAAHRPGPISTATTSRILKGVSGWQSGPTGVTPDQPAGTGGGGQKAVAGACLSRLACEVGALVGQKDQCKAALGTALTASHLDNQLWLIADTLLLQCEQPNGTRLCVTVSADSKRNVTMQPCRAGSTATQAWNLAALDPASAAARRAHGGLQLQSNPELCLTGSKACSGSQQGDGQGSCHGGTWVERCNSSGWTALDGSDAVQGPWYRVTASSTSDCGTNCTLPGHEMVRVCGHISNYQRGGQPPLGYCLVVDHASWYLTAGGVASAQRELPRVIARGRLPTAVAEVVAKRAFVELALQFKADTISASVGGTPVLQPALEDRMSPYGMVALGSGWHIAEFADLKIEPLPPSAGEAARRRSLKSTDSGD